MPVSEQTYRAVALEDPESHWELDCGRLREKPPMAYAHNRITSELASQLFAQLDRHAFEVRINAGQLRRSARQYYVPDVTVVAADQTQSYREHPETLEVYIDPLPLVVEVWSPSTGEYDVDSKLPEYQRRGDWEIWRIHPYEKTLTAWQRQPNGSYTETQHLGGIVQPAFLPDVRIDLDELFDI
jgi:Uma2 family endonuclease